MGRKKHRRPPSGLGDNPDGLSQSPSSDPDDGVLWAQEVQIRPRSERNPMSEMRRIRSKVAGFFGRGLTTTEVGDDGTTERANGSDDGDASVDERPQFTVTKARKNVTLADRIRDSVSHRDVDEHTYDPNSLFAKYIHWTFRASFRLVFMSFLFVFMVLIVFFGALLLSAGNQEPGCITVSGQVFGTVPEYAFADAFALSWTTFTTVGYGAVYTATGQDAWSPDQRDCWVVVGLSTTESFVGLLYAGMCAAILFSKIGRIQSHAQVRFGSAICIKFGSRDDAGIDVGQAEEGARGKVPCPVLMFQAVNLLCNERGGEILDAHLKVLSANNRADVLGMQAAYRNVKLMESEHPFFSRVWQGRHVLDADSPLLSPYAKQRIRERGGSWPVEWTNARDVRNALQFTDLIVTLVGISNVSAVSVHAYKRYKFGDVLVGYEFASVLYTVAGSNYMKVDFSLFDDVVEQEDNEAEAVEPEEDEENIFTNVRLSKSVNFRSVVHAVMAAEEKKRQAVLHEKKRQAISLR